MKLEEMTSTQMAQYYTDLFIANLISMWGTMDKKVKKINDKTHFGILKVCKYIDRTFPESKAIIDELGKIDIPEAQMEYIKLSISFGVNTEDAFARLRNLTFECEKRYKTLSVLTDEGKRNSSLRHLVKDIAWRTHKYLCYNLPNVNQKNIKYYDKEFLKEQLAVLDEKNGGPVRLT